MKFHLDELKRMATLDNFARFLNESSTNEKCLSCGDTDMYMYLTNIVEVGPEPKTAEECDLGTFVMLDYIGPFTGYPGYEDMIGKISITMNSDLPVTDVGLFIVTRPGPL